MVYGDVCIVLMVNVEGFYIVEGEIDLCGFLVVGCDGKFVGIVKEVWVDWVEYFLCYYEVELGEVGFMVLLLNNFVVIKKGKGVKLYFYVYVIMFVQFVDVLVKVKVDFIILLEEDKIVVYFGVGLFYVLCNWWEVLL